MPGIAGCTSQSIERASGAVSIRAKIYQARAWRTTRAPSLPVLGEGARGRPKFPFLPRLRDDPKIVGGDDPKVIGDSVAEPIPIFGDGSPKERHDSQSELREGLIGLVVGDLFVHDAPAPFDGSKMRTIGWR